MHSIFLPKSNVAAVMDRRTLTGPHIIVQPAKPRVAPMPCQQWPLWARAIAKYRQPQDTGLGDTIVHLIGDTLSERFKKWFARKFGKTCGCTERQRWLNARFPYRPRLRK